MAARQKDKCEGCDGRSCTLPRKNLAPDLSTKRQTKLCQLCRNIDIEKAIKDPWPSRTRLVEHLGDIRRRMKSPRCPLCRLFASVYIPAKQMNKGATTAYHLRALRGVPMIGPDLSTGRNFGASTTVLGIFPGSKDNIPKATYLNNLTRGFIGPVLPRRPHEYQSYVQRVSQLKVDFSRVRDWLQICETKHASTCALKTLPPPIGFRCIDLHSENMMTVTIGPDDDYLALSYVWADSHTSNGTEHKGNLVQSSTKLLVPQVIVDAMTVAQELGIRYLWVDKFCINQHNEEEKATQIGAMDRIYEGATATIIAAYRKDTSPALPGVSRRRMSKQAVERVKAYKLASTLPDLAVAVALSSWVTRAWTYQEAVLSRRCIIFTDEQVYFLCRGGTACESIATSVVSGMQSLGSRSFMSYAFTTNFMEASPRLLALWEFFMNLHHYKNRILRFESDSINAFQGILARSKFANIWGIPLACPARVSSDQDERALAIGFARGLWWDNPGHPLHEPLKPNERYAAYIRCPDFPSYSWAGWRGPTRLHEFRGDKGSDTGCNEVDESSFNVEFSCLSKSEEQISLLQMVQDTGHPISQVLCVEAPIHQVRIRRHPTRRNPAAYICDCDVNRECESFHYSYVQPVRLFEDPLDGSWLSEIIFTRFWHVLPLFILKGSGTIAACLIIDLNEESELPAHVIGFAYLRKSLLKETPRQRIRLA